MRKFIYGIKNLIKWFPIIWKDRDWDYYYIMEIYKKKLLFTAKHMRKNGYHENSPKYAEQIENCAAWMHMVQNEVLLDAVIQSKNASEDDLNKAIAEHDELRKKLFTTMEENIESWWN